MRWLIFSPKRLYMLLLSLLLVSVGVCVLMTLSHSMKAIEPQEILENALTRTKALKSFSYRIETQLITSEGTRCLSDVNGTCILPDRVSAKGKIFSAPVEVVQVQGITYIKDRFTAKWLALEGDRLGETGVFMAELEPLSLFQFREVPVAVWDGKNQDKKLYVLEFRPQLENRFLIAQFTDFTYRLFVEPKEYHVVKVEVRARSKETPTRLLVRLGLDDFDGIDRIEPPLASGIRQP